MTPAIRRHLAEIREIPDSEIDYSDIPRLSAASMRKALRNPASVRNPLGRAIRAEFAVELDRDVTAWLQSLGKSAKTRANSVLRAAMKEAKAG